MPRSVPRRVDVGRVAQLRLAALLLGPFIILVSKALGLYDRDQHRLGKTTVDEAPLAAPAGDRPQHGRLARRGVGDRTDTARSSVGTRDHQFRADADLASRARALALRMTPAERCLVVGNAVAAERTR